MGMTITGKILARAAGLDAVRPGQFLDYKVDQVASMDLQGKLVFNTLEALNAESLFDSDRVAFTLDHQSPAQTVAIADAYSAIRVAAKKLVWDKRTPPWPPRWVRFEHAWRGRAGSRDFR